MYMLVMVLDLIRVQSFHYLAVAWIKIIIFGADRSSSVHIDNKKKRYLNQGSDDTTLTAEVKYLIDFLR